MTREQVEEKVKGLGEKREAELISLTGSRTDLVSAKAALWALNRRRLAEGRSPYLGLGRGEVASPMRTHARLTPSKCRGIEAQRAEDPYAEDAATIDAARIYAERDK